MTLKKSDTIKVISTTKSKCITSSDEAFEFEPSKENPDDECIKLYTG